MPLEFPRALLREQSHSWNLRGAAMSGALTADNVMPVVRSDGGGFWVCSMSNISLSGNRTTRGRDRQKISTLLWRAIRQIMDAGVGQMIVPRNDALFRPWPDGIPTSTQETEHSDSTPFSDGGEYYQSVIDIRVAANAALRATQMSVFLGLSGQLMGGEAFSIEHPTMGWRLYEIATVVMTDDTHAQITFRPPLREAVTSGALMEFDRPRCLMRITTPDAMDLSVVPWTFNTANLSLVEAFS